MLHKGFLPDNGKGPRKGVDSKEGGVGSKGSVGGRRKQQAAESSALPSASLQARLAQSAERKALNLVVVGSSPTVGVCMASSRAGMQLNSVSKVDSQSSRLC